MGHALMRSAFSANIKERRDFSCAIFDSQARMIAQAAHIPVHLGSAPMSVQAVVDSLTLQPGESAIVNDPYAGGTHLPDITIVTPVFLGEFSAYYVASRAHHADVGGATPGSMPLAEHIDEEGVRIPPSVWTPELEADFLSRVRGPHERAGDLRAQRAANLVGVKRLKALVASRGEELVASQIDALFAWSRRIMARTFSALPRGTWSATEHLDGDGLGTFDIPITVHIRLDGERVVVDFRQSADQVRGPMNAVRAITVSAVHYVFRCLGPTTLPSNDGFMEDIEVLTRSGSVVDAMFPAAVNAGNVETSQRIVDVLLAALAPALPEQIPAASCGTMTNFLFGGTLPSGKQFTHYETLPGGSGAGPGWNGESAVQTHMTNTLNTPIEALEHTVPVQIVHSRIRRGSGGDGRYTGGAGLEREVRFLAPVEVTVLAERQRHSPPGLAGGGDGAPGETWHIHANGEAHRLPAKVTTHLEPGEAIRIATPGGGGHGSPVDPPEKDD
jgi:N-methylhydantoinase B